MVNFVKNQRVKLKVGATSGSFSYKAGQAGRIMGAFDTECYVELVGYAAEREWARGWKEKHHEAPNTVPFVAMFHPDQLEAL